MVMTAAQARKKIMDYIALRDHSEKELRQKLEAQCDANVVDDALAWARSQMWMSTPDQLQEKIVQQLHRRGKGIIAINKSLQDKGLSPSKPEPEQEYSKALELVSVKWSPTDFTDLASHQSQKLKTKILRFLLTRGFEIDIAHKILKDELKAGVLSHED